MIHFTDSREARWYYFNRRRRVGPFTTSELCSLITKGAITHSTLVREKNSTHWQLAGHVTAHRNGRARMGFAAVAAGSIVVCIFCWTLLQESGQDPSLVVLETPLLTSAISNDTGEQLKQASETMKSPNDPQNAASVINNPGLTGASIDPFEKTHPELSTSSLGGDRTINSVQPIPTFPLPVQQKTGQLVQEFWRSIEGSTVIMRYGRYLRDYPQGLYADLAVVRIGELKSEVTAEKSDSSPSKKRIIRPSRKPQLNGAVRIVTEMPPEPTRECTTRSNWCRQAPGRQGWQCKLDATSEACVVHNYSHSARPSTNR
jgi:hypothetical protein